MAVIWGPGAGQIDRALSHYPSLNTGQSREEPVGS